MYNKVILMGRICHDLELRTTPNGISVVTFRLAVDRAYSAKGEERKTDFFNIVAWRTSAEFICRYFGKGRMIMIDGELQSRQYTDKNGMLQTVVEIVVDRAAFTGEPKAAGSSYSSGGYSGNGYSSGGSYQSQPASADISGSPAYGGIQNQVPAMSSGSDGEFQNSDSDDDDDYPF